MPRLGTETLTSHCKSTQALIFLGGKLISELPLFDLDEFLGFLYTGEGRRKVILRAVELGITRDPKFIDEAIKLHLDGGSLYEAADLAAAIGNNERATALRDEAVGYRARLRSRTSEDISDDLNMLDRAKSLEIEVMRERRKGNFWKAIELYERAQLYDWAASEARRSGHYDKAIQLYEANGSFRDAAYIAVKVRQYRRAMILFERAGHFEHAAELAEQVGEKTTAEAYRTLCKKLQLIW